MPTTDSPKTDIVQVRFTAAQRRQIDELVAAGFGPQADVIRTAVDRMHKEEIRMNGILTDNAWVKRVEEIRQMVADVPTAPATADDVNYYIDEVFELTNGAEIEVAKREFVRLYNVTAA